MCARVVRAGETSATTSTMIRRATRSAYARPLCASRPSGGDLADHADAHAQRVARQAGEREALDLDRAQRLARRPRGDGSVRGDPARARARLLARQRLEDLVHLAAHLADGG